MSVDATPHTMIVQDTPEEVLREKTECEVKNRVEDWLREDDHECSSCGSTAVDAMDIEVNGHRLYDFDRLASRCHASNQNLVMFKVGKQNGSISTEIGGSDWFGPQFAKCSLELTASVIANLRKDDFVTKERGQFLLVLTGPDNKKTQESQLKVERIRNVELSPEEVRYGAFELSNKMNDRLRYR